MDARSLAFRLLALNMIKGMMPKTEIAAIAIIAAP
jgi:hypothetical protein